MINIRFAAAMLGLVLLSVSNLSAQPLSGTPDAAEVASLLTNGGFEQGDATDPPLEIASFGPTATGPAGWTVTRGNVDWIGPSRWQAAEGNCCLDLDAPGEISQTLATVPGKVYVLAFEMAGNAETEPAAKQLRVTVGNRMDLFEFDATGRASSDLGWIKQQIVFQATGESTSIVFGNASPTPTASGVALDCVTLCDAAVVAPLGDLPVPVDAAQAANLPIGRWSIDFANGVSEVCQVQANGTAFVVEPLRQSGGKATAQEGAVVIAFDDDRIERWTPVGRRMVVEHWFPASQYPSGKPVLGIAELTE